MHRRINIISGTQSGGKKAAKKIKAKYGDDFYSRLGKKGGAASGTGGFYANRELARVAGRLGGLKTKADYKTT